MCLDGLRKEAMSMDYLRGFPVSSLIEAVGTSKNFPRFASAHCTAKGQN